MSQKTHTSELCHISAVRLTEMIRAREISVRELVAAFLERIDRINPKINAYVTVCHDQAMDRAIKADAELRAGAAGLLHGLPVSIKDLSWTAGVRTTFGSRAFSDFVPAQTSPAAARLMNAGGIMLGKTNTPEFGWLATTDNEIFGASRNPWNLNMTPSGSSGGAAAAVAAGLSPIALGSDGGGSIRHPASFCGVFGIKPTFGVVPRHPEIEGWPTLSHQGPITRTAADAALAMDAMAGLDANDLYSVPSPAPADGFLKNIKRDMKGLRVAWTTDLGFAQVDPRVRRVFEPTRKVFEELGCEVDEAAPDVREAGDIFKWVMFSEAAASGLRHFDAEGKSPLNAELAKFVWKRRDILARDYLGALARREAMYGRVAEFFRSYDLLVTPTMAIPPFELPRTMADYPHTVNGVEVGTTGWHPFTYPFNLTHQPAASVNCGFTEDGLPVGLQIVGRRFEDLLVLQAAHAFEEATPWSATRPPEVG